jgi:acetyl-CoA C-acetyltransferase
MSAESLPIIVGVGQITVRDESLDALSTPLDLMERAAEAAAADAGLRMGDLSSVDGLAVVKSFREPMRNTPEALAARLDMTDAPNSSGRWLTPDGGNAPQGLVNLFSQAIAGGRHRLVLLTGAEAIDNARRLIKSGTKPDWDIPSSSDPTLIWPDQPMASAHERAHGVWQAAHVYPLFENALRHHLGRSIDAHQAAMGKLFEGFSRVAARSPHAWFPTARSVQEIATAGPRNRYVGWPYTKFMNAMNQVNQSAALLLTSTGHARSMGIPEDRWIYLHGCADTTEIWRVSERVNFHSCPAIGVMGERALAKAGRQIDEISHFDLYSCFPSAVEIARSELGIAEDDPRPLTVTGGLPFHGGAGNNYSMNAIAAMAEILRQDPGSLGMVTANGGYLSKHSAGIYSSAPPPVTDWRRENPADYQKPLDARSRPPLVEQPSGSGWIETYTICVDRDGAPERGIVVGRLGHPWALETPRFLATVDAGRDELEAMTREECVGREGTVTTGPVGNIFQLT